MVSLILTPRIQALGSHTIIPTGGKDGYYVPVPEKVKMDKRISIKE